VALTPREERLVRKNKRPVFDKHPRHIILDYSQVKEIVKRSAESTPTGHHSAKMPHQRRGCWRRLTSDRFKEKKVIWVRPADINKGLKIAVGHRTYDIIR